MKKNLAKIAWIVKFNKKKSGLSELCQIEALDVLGKELWVKCNCKVHKNKQHRTSMYTLFPTRKEAISWIDGNEDFEVIRVKLFQ